MRFVQYRKVRFCSIDEADISCIVLDKLERKYGGERFTNPENMEKNAAMNAKLSQRIKTLGPQVARQLFSMVSNMVR